MTTDYFQYGALASPARTPEHTPPELSVPKPSSRARDFTSKSAPLPFFDSSDDRDSSAHAFDPNRFTPSLHASLVSEILSLRRELDSKHKFIDNLEESLKTAHNENEALSDQLRESNKKSRQLEQKFRYLESGTFDAVEGLLGERDNVKIANQELRNKLDVISKKAKSLEHDNARSKDSWDKEKHSWENEKRQLEQRVHVSETRLRKMVEEMNTQQIALEAQRKTEDASGDSDVDDVRSYQQPKHIRNQSSMSIRSLAPSICSVRRPGMTSLANELNSEDEDYDTEDFAQDEEDIPLAVDRRLSRASATSDCKAKKILGITPNANSEASTEGDDARAPSIDSVRTPSIAARLGLVWSRTSSRSVSPAASAKQKDDSDGRQKDAGVEILEPTAQTPTHLKLVDQGTQPKSPNLLTSDGSVEASLSPRNTPQYSLSDNARTESYTKPTYQSSSTQTGPTAAGDLVSRRNASLAPIEVASIPAITIQPPMSPSFGQTVLPTGMRSTSVQTEDTVIIPMQNVGVQTEEIRIDRRPIKLPPHLLPSALEDIKDKDNGFTPSHENQNMAKHRPTMHRSTFSKDGNRLPLKPIDLPPPKLRSTSHEKHQLSELKAQFEPSATLPSWYAELHVTDNLREGSDDVKPMFGHTSGFPRPSVRSLFDGPPKTVPEARAISPAILEMKTGKQPLSTGELRQGSDGGSVQSRPSSSRAGGSSRRTGPFFNSHKRSLSRPGSTSSYGSQAPPPPFPIPGRMSSRPPSHDGPQSPIAREAQFMRSRRSSKDARIASGGGLRKVQSSGAMRANTRMSPRRRIRAPDLEPIQSMAFDVLPDNLLLPGMVTPAHEDFGSSNDAQLGLNSPDFDLDSDVEEEEEKSQDNVVVDAIAATMVGEWMWKYVRRRKSFGLGEPRGDQFDDGTTGGVRHKRWVWLSPYEHTVMWSAKQPNSGPALLGKTGRKLIIKSVLDVKDTTPLHKSASHEPVFDRSILIITPERALKFTASTKERHYLWLTALSFLAQSGRGPPQVPRVSPMPEAMPGRHQRRRSSLMPGAGLLSSKTAIGLEPAPARIEVPQRLGTADSTAPPNISRFSGAGHHQRKRSSTNPPSSAASDKFSPAESSMTASSVFAHRASNTTSYRSPADSSTKSSVKGTGERSSYFEAVGTMRMDAFMGHGRYEDHSSQQSDARRDHRRRDEGTMQDTMAGKGYMFGESEVDPFDEF